jgi:hypothetical protein
MLPHLKALVKHITKLRKASLEACHCVNEFILWQIHPPKQRENVAFEYPRFADPSHNSSYGKNPKLYSLFEFSFLL